MRSDTYLIGYDITSPRRLQRVHRAMKKFGCPIEYSIFLFTGNAARLDDCLTTVRKIMNPAADDVRCYKLSKRGLRQRIGKAVLPDGVIWTGLPSGTV